MGYINKIQLENGSQEDMATLNFEYPKEKVLFMCYKPKDRLYFIIISSKTEDFDLSVLKFLNLDGRAALASD